MSLPIMSSAKAHSSIGNVQGKPLVLNEGQMVHGQIKQLFPGQTAEIQIGNQRLIAKLEVPMKAGDSYYFQVTSVKPELQMKIIAGPISVAEGQSRQLDSLTEALQLPRSAEMTQLLSFVMKNKIPMTREGLLQAEGILKGVPPAARTEALAVIQKIVELKLPFTESVFRSLFGVESKEGLHTVLASLRSALMGDSTVTPQVRESVVSALDKMAKPFAEATRSTLLGKALITLLDSSDRPETRFAAVQLLKGAGVLPERASLANIPQVLTSLITNEPAVARQALPGGLPGQQVMQSTQALTSMLRQINSAPATTTNAQLEGLKALISDENGFSTANKEALTAIVDRALTARPSSEVTTRFVQEFSQALIRISAESSITTPFRANTSAEGPKDQLLTLLGQQGRVDMEGLKGQQATSEKLAVLVRNAERSDNPAVHKLLQSAEGAVANAVEGKAVKDAIQTIVRSFGLNYESALLGKEPNVGRLAESLKPQLVALMNNLSVSQTVRDSAESVVVRMNGPLLMSGENGVQHQLIMQVPLEIFGKLIDATLQWNGRMKDNGKIDPDFARILFYLDLHSLDKTIVDMQVQNRIVSVTIFNADPKLHTVGALMSEKLKEGLESTGYKLSGVFFKSHSEEKVNKQPIVQKVSDSQGVDFRI